MVQAGLTDRSGGITPVSSSKLIASDMAVLAALHCGPNAAPHFICSFFSENC